MEEILLLLKRVIVLLIRGGAAFLTLFMFLVPTSSPYQVEQDLRSYVIYSGTIIVYTRQMGITELRIFVAG
jgi:hypothetical protein